MKLKGEIIEATSTGDGIRISIQAKIGKASWKPMEQQTVIVDGTAANRRAFHLGRMVCITVKPI